ncbi:MAG: hypothetical protein UX08_C0013G0006 [Candidatus Collierbacteria bacterium GW2011_GWB1_45_35]|uniref:Nucleoside 2-deoxyribosyltransferase n=1 Tax=Candidatus Collierbacteria bacterium GW2011_GWB2_45_17 TaxID=1618388 RepID=A0A837II21_9BACT|nr:MAG: hypothetical protein UW48_C0008G0006 [Microgenomates group bacterium GW2011_GWC1_44_23]KKT95339.1 MAG: hypothetical protein UW96_C0008G0006 [Candidatus Collierbacteria bacterium GW2011_GWA1_45_15]KKT99611.1 MAG: hypothetical protein UX01_C0009G0041 [Candidatus Collierbacteria bacterium GW2011_GWB2_45_17]KKU04916.1 MAG: hypothetical protein UX08_C0013G0006 [Candidatus Collierbacteria bacterium GW2011_GWB1_45_35]KKU06996.1 MAG: hypothetical protein UX11_C0022G0029 [Candidatus Collierbacte
MKQFLLYCAGAITGISYAGSTDWREYVSQKLPPFITAVSPMRGKKYLSQEKNVKASYEDIPLSSQKGIMTRDRMDVMRCDMILVNLLGTEKVSIGSVMEVAWADAFRKPVILVMEKDNLHSHPMLREAAGFIVSDLDEAITIAIAVLSPTI